MTEKNKKDVNKKKMINPTDHASEAEVQRILGMRREPRKQRRNVMKQPLGAGKTEKVPHSGKMRNVGRHKFLQKDGGPL